MYLDDELSHLLEIKIPNNDEQLFFCHFEFEPQLKGPLGLSLIVNVMHSQMDKTNNTI